MCWQEWIPGGKRALQHAVLSHAKDSRQGVRVEVLRRVPTMASPLRHDSAALRNQGCGRRGSIAQPRV